MKKTLSFILAILMIMATMPMALAAETLSASNVTQWPTIEYITTDGKLHFGQILSESIKINDDEIVLDSVGNQVEGHFEFLNPDSIPTAGTGKKANIKFIPDDNTKYSGFTKRFCANVVYNVETVTLVPIDHDTNPLVATEVEAGAELNTSILSGAKYTNPYNPEEPGIVSGEWSWIEPSTKVNESGYYDAIFRAAGYEFLKAQVYVRIAGEIPETTIAEMPTFPEFTYDGVTTWGDINLVGGKAALKVEGTEVEGTFAISGRDLNEVIYVVEGTTEVTFTPADPESALPYIFRIPFKVNPAPLVFKDADGNIIPNGEFIFEVEPNEKINNIKSKLYDYIQMPANSVYRIETDDTYAVNGKEYMVYVIHSDSNYVGSEIYFTVKFKETVVEPKIVGIGYNKYRMDCGSYSLPGTFAVAVMKDGALVDTIVTKSGATFEFAPTASGKYTFNVAYVPVEGDYFIVDAFSKEYDVALNWAATIGDISTMHRCGDTVEAKVANTGVIGWKATDTNGNLVSLTLVSGTMESETFTFIMPDHNVIITPEFEAADDNTGGGILDGIGDIDGIDGILDWLKNLIEKIKSIFEKIIEFFQSIGDMS